MLFLCTQGICTAVRLKGRECKNHMSCAEIPLGYEHTLNHFWTHFGDTFIHTADMRSALLSWHTIKAECLALPYPRKTDETVSLVVMESSPTIPFYFPQLISAEEMHLSSTIVSIVPFFFFLNVDLN